MQGCMKSFFGENRGNGKSGFRSMNKFSRMVLTSLKIML